MPVLTSRISKAKTLIAVLVGGLITISGYVGFKTPAQAATGLEGFQPGYIIHDSLMYGPSAAYSLTDSQIQEFLNQYGASCRIGSDGTACLKNASFATTTIPASQWCPSSFTGSTQDSAASIIGKAARACEISPKVLLVILQKEQGLITSTNPSAYSFSHATGFGCPDSGGCASQYAGFPQQVYAAASRLQQYRLQPGSFNYQTGTTKAIQYHPNAACGSLIVTISNAATAALYNYTPYTPNTAALSAVTGTGDSCSSYGNRNFYRTYNTWFGLPNPSDPSPTPPTPTTPTTPTTPPLQGIYSLAPGSQIGNGWNPHLAYGVGDWSADGNPDIAYILNNGAMTLYQGTSTGGWNSPIPIGQGWNDFTTLASGHDFNGDSHPDIIARNNATGSLTLYPSDGRGGFSLTTPIGVGWNGMAHIALVPQWINGHTAIAAIDKTTGQLIMYVGNGTGGFSQTIPLGYGWNAMTSIAGIGDMNGDGRGELISVGNNGDIYLYTALGSSFTLSATLSGTQTAAVLPSTTPETFFRISTSGLLYRSTATLQ